MEIVICFKGSGFGMSTTRCTIPETVPSWTRASAAPRTGGPIASTPSGGGSPPAVNSPGN